MNREPLKTNDKKLGFGLMRLPMQGEEIDLVEVKAMVDRFMKAGFTYFDTAYVYGNGKSELAAGEALVKRYPRDSFRLATKLPIWAVKQPEDMQRIFDTQLERTGAGYFDYYLLHALNRDSYLQTETFGAWQFGLELKEKGLIRHLGFSFHDDAQCLDKILTEHPEAEFVQLQINYADWEDKGVQSRLCYEVARKHGTPIIVMEPLKGGALAAMPPEIQGIFRQANPNASVASWAMRYAASLDGVMMVLSGMSDMAQMDDNVSYMADFQPMTASEHAIVADVVERLKKIPTIPCTACKYCVDECPQKINIPGVFEAFNDYTLYNNLVSAKGQYRWNIGKGGKASDCIACGACESHCPQHIHIPELFENIAKVLE